jgi:3-oxoacyl-[acyl-carrier protein] reductase
VNERLDGRVALVTGGSRGIGRACCEALAAKGASVAVHCRTRLDLTEETVEKITAKGGQATAFQADLAETSAPDMLVRAILPYTAKSIFWSTMRAR